MDAEYDRIMNEINPYMDKNFITWENGKLCVNLWMYIHADVMSAQEAMGKGLPDGIHGTIYIEKKESMFRFVRIKILSQKNYGDIMELLSVAASIVQDIEDLESMRKQSNVKIPVPFE